MLERLTMLSLIIFEIIMIIKVTGIRRYKLLPAIFTVTLIAVFFTGYCLGIVRNMFQIAHLLMAVMFSAISLKEGFLFFRPMLRLCLREGFLFFWKMLKSQHTEEEGRELVDALCRIIFFSVLTLIYFITIIQKWECIDRLFIDTSHWSPC